MVARAGSLAAMRQTGGVCTNSPGWLKSRALCEDLPSGTGSRVDTGKGTGHAVAQSSLLSSMASIHWPHRLIASRQGRCVRGWLGCTCMRHTPRQAVSLECRASRAATCPPWPTPGSGRCNARRACLTPGFEPFRDPGDTSCTQVTNSDSTTVSSSTAKNPSSPRKVISSMMRAGVCIHTSLYPG